MKTAAASIRRALGCAALLLLVSASPAAAAAVLTLDEVLASVAAQYPPMLAALIERDIADGRLRSAEGTFDFQVFAKVFGNPTGYYEQGTVDVGFEQFTGVWGSTIYGGYRLNRGDTLPDYDKNRTQRGGEPRLGFRLPLLRDGRIDSKRAAVFKAQLDRDLADPSIRRQQLDFVRAASVAYWGWVGAGQRWKVAEQILAVAEDRARALADQVKAGLVAPLVVTDNERLVVSRSLAVVQARRRFEAAALTLSLFLRDADEQPVVAGRERLPAAMPAPGEKPAPADAREIEVALERRPELRRLDLSLEKARIDLKLARNQRLPNLDAGVVVSDNLDDRPYKDQTETEVQMGLEFRMPLQRREAEGRIVEFEGVLQQLDRQKQFARERIAAEVRDARSALTAALEQARQAERNVFLAGELQEAERERFRAGASDLLAVQIREQAAFDAQVLEVESRMDYFRALADLAAATAQPAGPSTPKR
jgi:outer membrane protein TolC